MQRTVESILKWRALRALSKLRNGRGAEEEEGICGRSTARGNFRRNKGLKKKNPEKLFQKPKKKGKKGQSSGRSQRKDSVVDKEKSDRKATFYRQGNDSARNLRKRPEGKKRGIKGSSKNEAGKRGGGYRKQPGDKPFKIRTQKEKEEHNHTLKRLAKNGRDQYPGARGRPPPWASLRSRSEGFSGRGKKKSRGGHSARRDARGEKNMYRD